MISLMDRIVSAYFRNEQLPLEGNARITLTNTVTGEQKVIEKHNMVTGAVANVLANNYCGLARYADIMPLKNLYSGVLCFQNTITESADNYMPPSEATNPMVAHAGDEPNTTAEQNSSRGSPNTGEMVVTDTSIKFVWDFSTNQGNGTINCVCLCPNSLGNLGLRPYDTGNTFFQGFGEDRWTGVQAVDEEGSKRYPWSISADGKTSISLYLSGDTFKERTMRHDYTAFGIMRGTQDWQTVSTRATTVRSNSSTNARRFMFDDATYYYVALVTGATSLQVDKIAKSDMTVTQADCTFSGISLYTGTLYGAPNVYRMFAFDGTSLYLPNSTNNGIIRVNLTNNADVEILTGETPIDVGRTDYTGSYYVGKDTFFPPVVLNSGLILGSNYLINGNKVYRTLRPNGICVGTTYGSAVGEAAALVSVKRGASYYCIGRQTESNSYYQGQGNLLVKMFLSTILNLEEPVVKQNIMTMKIEYTLTEA